MRVIGSLALFGFLIGLMIGRLFQPDPLWLERVEEREQGLELWFNVEPVPREEHAGGVFILRLESFGREQQGQLQVQGRGDWRAEEVDGRWRLLVSLVEQ